MSSMGIHGDSSVSHMGRTEAQPKMSTGAKILDFFHHSPPAAGQTRKSGGLFMMGQQSKAEGFEKAGALSRLGHAVLGLIKAGASGTIVAVGGWPALVGAVVGSMILAGAASLHNDGLTKTAAFFAVIGGALVLPYAAAGALAQSAYADLSLATTGRARNLFGSNVPNQEPSQRHDPESI